MVWPAPDTLRLDASGTPPRAGAPLRTPAPPAAVAVTFMRTAATPAEGTPTRPAIGNDAATPPVSRGRGSPARVSRARTGTSGVKRPSVEARAPAPVT